MCLCGVCSPVVVLGLSVRLSWCPMLLRDCGACTVVCVYAARLLGCEGDGNAGVVAVSVYMDSTRGSGVLDSAGDVLKMSVVRGVGGVCDMCMCLARSGV